MPEKNIELFILAHLKQRSAMDGNEQKFPLFQGLSTENLRRLLSNAGVGSFPAGAEIVRQGDTANFLYFIISGGVKTIRYSTNGLEATLRMLTAGETFMDAVIFMDGNSPINAQTTEKSILLMIPSETVRRHALHDPQFALNLLKIVTRHYRDSLQQIDGIVTKTPVERLGRYFLKLHLDQKKDSMEIELPFQKAVIANHLGITPETFSRALLQIRKMGVDAEKETLTLHNFHVLCRFCDLDLAQTCARRNTGKCTHRESRAQKRAS